MSDELKPCPWCGSTDEPDVYDEPDSPDQRVWCPECGAEGPTATIGCRDPEEDGPLDVASEARDAWNTRPVEDELRAEVARLRAELLAERRSARDAHASGLEEASELLDARAAIPMTPSELAALLRARAEAVRKGER